MTTALAARHARVQKTPLAQVIREEALVLVAMQRRLVEAGLVVTAAQVNKAANSLGWEGAELLSRKP